MDGTQKGETDAGRGESAETVILGRAPQRAEQRLRQPSVKTVIKIYYRKDDRSSYEVQLLSGVHFEDEGEGA